jgi:hypothetical protein
MSGPRKLNRAWHEKNPMPKNPSMVQRIKWHRAHMKNCGCRDVPKSLRKHLVGESDAAG